MAYFCFHDDYYELAQKVPKRYRGEFYEAIAAYVFEGVEKDLKGVAKTIFDHAIKKRLNSADALKERQRRKRNSDKDITAEVDVKSVTVTQNVTGMVRGKEVRGIKENPLTGVKEKAKETHQGNAFRFSPPSRDKLEDFIEVHGYDVDAKRFLSHYESNGWKVGRNPMKDWRAAVRVWHHRNATPEKSRLAKEVEHAVAGNPLA